jgi:hypothetical protein
MILSLTLKTTSRQHLIKHVEAVFQRLYVYHKCTAVLSACEERIHCLGWDKTRIRTDGHADEQADGRTKRIKCGCGQKG